MAVIEITAFELSPDADERAFLDVDKQLQTEVIYQHPGLLRRTTARGTEGGWMTIVHWRSAEDAATSKHLAADDPVAQQFAGFIDPSSVRSRLFEALD